MSQNGRYFDSNHDVYHSGNFTLGAIVGIALSLLLWGILLLVTVLLFVSDSHAEPTYKGHDFLSIQSPYFDIKGVTALLKPDSAIGSLHTTFGTSLANVDYMLSSGKVSLYRVHLLDGTCLPVRSCGYYSPLSKASVRDFDYKVRKNDRAIYKYFSQSTTAYCALLRKYPQIAFLISPVLEHRLSPLAWTKLTRFIKRLCPAALIVNNSVYGSNLPGIKEVHNDIGIKRTTIVSSDGMDMRSSFYTIWKAHTKNAFVRFLHFPIYNCRFEQVFTEPRSRTQCLTARKFKSILETYK